MCHLTRRQPRLSCVLVCYAMLCEQSSLSQGYSCMAKESCPCTLEPFSQPPILVTACLSHMSVLHTLTPVHASHALGVVHLRFSLSLSLRTNQGCCHTALHAGDGLVDAVGRIGAGGVSVCVYCVLLPRATCLDRCGNTLNTKHVALQHHAACCWWWYCPSSESKSIEQ